MIDMKKVRWGVISTANIGINKVLPGMIKSEHCELLAMSSRDLRKAQKAARRLGTSKGPD
jgi:predicted dehydrogenase